MPATSIVAVVEPASDRDCPRQCRVVGRRGGAAGDRVVDDGVTGRCRGLRHGKHTVDRTSLIAVGGTGNADQRGIVIEDVDAVAVVGTIDRDARITRRNRIQRDDDRLGTFDEAISQDAGDVDGRRSRAGQLW